MKRGPNPKPPGELTCECGKPSAPGAYYGGTHGRACADCRKLDSHGQHSAPAGRTIPPSRGIAPPINPGRLSDERVVLPALDTNTLPYGLSRYLRDAFIRPVPLSRI